MGIKRILISNNLSHLRETTIITCEPDFHYAELVIRISFKEQKFVSTHKKKKELFPP